MHHGLAEVVRVVNVEVLVRELSADDFGTSDRVFVACILFTYPVEGDTSVLIGNLVDPGQVVFINTVAGEEVPALTEEIVQFVHPSFGLLQGLLVARVEDLCEKVGHH